MRSNYELTIKPNDSNLLDLKELWFYRELFYIISWRDIKIRFKQTFLGILWVVFQPLTTMIIFTFFFGRLVKIPSDNLPYPLFVLIGLIFWNFFSGSVSLASNSLISNENLIKKIYMPKIVLPISSLVTNAVDFGINVLFLFVVILYFQYTPNLALVMAILYAFIITAITAGGIGLFLSALNVKYRDVRYILPFFLQILIFLSPVIYPSNLLNNSTILLFALNPLVGAIDSVRIVLSGTMDFNWWVILISTISAFSIAIFGLHYFESTQKYFADII